jgi:5-hydroxyisourate hydrolase-like protein (transthyretin family)
VETASEIDVRVGEVTTGIDAALAGNGRIAGTIRNAATGAPIPGAWVQLCGENICRDTSTAADGTYLSEFVPPGSYRAQAGATGYRTRYHRDAETRETADLVTVTVETTAAGIDIALPDLGHITGRVTDAATGQPLQGVMVRKVGTTTPTAWTGSDGRYDLGGLATGVYRLLFTDPQTHYAPWTSEQITVTEGQSATRDAQLEHYGYLSGRVTAAESGAPLGGIEARAGSTALARTAADGTYTLGPLPDGPYTVRFYDPGLRRVTAYSLAPVEVTRGRTTAGADGALTLMGIARGRVVDAETGAGVAGVRVTGRGDYGAYRPVYTDADGRYELPGLADGRYRLTLFDPAHRYQDGQTDVLDVASGRVIEVADARLPKWGEVRGRVTDGVTGQPVRGAWVKVYSASNPPRTLGSAVTAADGRYAVSGLSSGAYRAEFSHPMGWYLPQFYAGAPTLKGATVVEFVKGADKVGIDARLAWDGDGPPAEGVREVWLPWVER